MVRALPIVSARELEKAFSQDGMIIMVKITHPEIAGAIRLVTDAVDYFFEGQRWLQSGFDLSILSDDDKPPVTQFRFDNVDRKASKRLMDLSGRTRVDFRVFATSWFNRQTPRGVKAGLTPVPLYTARFCELVNVQMTASDVTGQLQLLDIRLEGWPSRRATKAQFPGLFLQ